MKRSSLYRILAAFVFLIVFLIFLCWGMASSARQSGALQSTLLLSKPK